MQRLIAGRLVNPIGLGCMGLTHGYGVPPGPDEGARVLDAALELGYDHLDTARLYGAGRNELLLGEVLKGRRERDSSPRRWASSLTARSGGRTVGP